MPSIRALERSDLPAVLDVVRTNFGPWPGDARFLAASLMDHPWADESLPSYLAVDGGGEVVGFIGAQARQLRFGDRTIRGVCCTKLGLAPDRRTGAAGALLMGRLLSGPQELTWSDSATDVVVRLWRLYGGHLDHVRACDWMLVLRPGRWLRSVLAAAMRRQTIRRDLIPVGALPFHAAGSRVMRRAFPELAPGVTGEDATTKAIVEHMGSFTRDLRLWVDHDEEHLQHLFEHVAAANGPLVRRLVRRRGRPIGWYAYQLRPGRVSRVLHVAAAESDADVVLGELINHAREGGSAVLAGRAEPHLMRSLQHRFAALGPARTPVIHCKDPEVAAILATCSSLLTRLDGEVMIP